MADNPIVFINYGGAEPGAVEVASVPVAPPPSVTRTVGTDVEPEIMQQSPAIITRLGRLQAEIDAVEVDSSLISVVEKGAGEVLSISSQNILLDIEQDVPEFTLPSPSSWTGRTCYALRFDQLADYAKITCAGGATINDRPQYIMAGESNAQFFSDGTNCFAAPSADQPFAPRTIIANGQSNMAAGPPGTVGRSLMTHYLGPDLWAWSNISNSFVEMVDGPANMRSTNDSQPGGGQVLTRVARLVADSINEDVYTFSAAYTGQSITYFLPDSLTNAFYSDGTQAGVNNYNLILNAVLASGRSPELIIWIQGEADATWSQAMYYGYLETLIDAWLVDYPLAKVVIVKTLGYSDAPAAGVAAAQQQAADTYPHVSAVDNSDMQGWTAWWGNQGFHYSDCCGYEEVGLRIYANMQGQTRPDVAQVNHIEQLVTWSSGYLYRHSVTLDGARPMVTLWQPYTGALSMGSSTAAKTPTAVPWEGNFGGRSIARFETADLQSSQVNMTADGTSWSFFARLQTRATSTTPIVAVLHMYDFVDGARLGLDVPGQVGAWATFYDGGDISFNLAPFIDQPQSVGLVIDSETDLATFYQNGLPVQSVAISGTQNLDNPQYAIGSILNVAQFFEGDIACHYIVNEVLSAEFMLNCHLWAITEMPPVPRQP